MKAAAVQLEPRIADVAENLARCERLADEAAARGAELIVLPEFFTTGMGFDERIADAALPPDGAATELLRRLARRHGAMVGGSYICRDEDGHNRNAFFLVSADGEVLGRHDKDLPTMWENCFYVGGSDDGVIDAGELTVGAAVCWELMRSQTARRLRGRIDLLVGGSAWWSIPPWPLVGGFEAGNARNAGAVAEAMARLVGAPFVHSAHMGELNCPMPLSPVAYQGHLEGGAVICDAAGRVLARRDRQEGPGVVVADVEAGRRRPLDDVPQRYWLHRRGPVAAFVWNYQRLHGRHWYRRHALGRPPARVELPAQAPPSGVLRI